MECRDCKRPIQSGKRCERCTKMRRGEIWEGVKKVGKVVGPMLGSVVIAVVTRGRVKPPLK